MLELTKPEPELKHSPLGASVMKRTWNCPGWINLARKHNALEGCAAGWDAAYGTVAHTVAAAKLQHYLGIIDDKQLEAAGVRIHSLHEVDGHRIQVDDKMLDMVEMYYEYIVARIKHYGMEPWQCYVEQSVSIPTTQPTRYPVRGTLDNGNYAPYTKLFIDDFKTGFTPVSADDNEQLMVYALGKVLELPEDERAELPEVEMSIIQPVDLDETTAVRTCTKTTAELLEWGKELDARVLATEDPNAPRVVGSWCQWCPVKMQCKEYTKDISDTVDEHYSDVKLPIISQWTNEQIGAFLDAVPKFKQAIEEVENLAFQKLLNGEEVPGRKLVAARSNRVWRDPVATEKQLGALLGADIYEAPKLKSPAQMEKLIAKKRSMNKANTRLGKEVKAFKPPDLEPLYTKPDKGFTMAAESDSRPRQIGNAELIDAAYSDVTSE